MPASVDLTDLTGDDETPADAAAAAGTGAAGGSDDVIDLLDSDDESDTEPSAPSGRGAKRSAPAGASAPAASRRRPSQPPARTRGVIDLSGDSMKVTVELGAGAAAAARAPLATASRSGGQSQGGGGSGGNGGGGASGEDDMWKCSICLDEMVNPASTTCGHLFCEECIKQCLKTAKKCPQCRKRLTAKTAYHRIYLPSRRPDGGGPPDGAFPAC
jgi:hypothetical protein